MKKKEKKKKRPQHDISLEAYELHSLRQVQTKVVKAPVGEECTNNCKIAGIFVGGERGQRTFYEKFVL